MARRRLGPPIGHTELHRTFWRYLEWAQDVIVVSLAVLLLVAMGQALWNLAQVALLEGRAPRVVLPQIVLLLILVELFRTLIVYLREHRVAVGLMIEVALVSVLRELLLNPPGGIPLADSLGIAVLLVVLGGLMVGDRLTSAREAGVLPDEEA